MSPSLPALPLCSAVLFELQVQSPVFALRSSQCQTSPLPAAHAHGHTRTCTDTRVYTHMRSGSMIHLHMQGVAEHIAARNVPKVFLLNGSHDRETTALPSSLSQLPHLPAGPTGRFASLLHHSDDRDQAIGLFNSSARERGLSQGSETPTSSSDDEVPPAERSYSTGTASHRLHSQTSFAQPSQASSLSIVYRETC